MLLYDSVVLRAPKIKLNRVMTTVTHLRRTVADFLGRDSSGFVLIETMIASTILAFVGVSVVVLMVTGVNSLGSSRQRTLAEQVAADQIEAIRQMNYGMVGVVNGNPGGTLAATTPVTMSGLHGTETIQVSWVSDPAPTAYLTYADYKRVTVTVRRDSDSKVLTQQSTYIGPASQRAYGGQHDAIIQAQVMDMGNNQPVAGAPVSLSGGPSPPAGDTTNANGTVIFPALSPNPTYGGQQHYSLAVTPPAGYTALADDVSPNSPAYVQLSAAQTFNTVLRVYRPATVNVTVTAGGNPYGSGNVTLTSSSRPTLTAPLANGSAQFLGVVPGIQYTANATIGGQTFTSNAQTVPNNYPSDLTSSYAFSLPYLVVTVKRASGSTCQTVSGATVSVTGGPQGVNVSQTTDASGSASFVVPSGAGYKIKAQSGSTKKTLTGQTVQPAPATTSITNSISGTCP